MKHYQYNNNSILSKNRDKNIIKIKKPEISFKDLKFRNFISSPYKMLKKSINIISAYTQYYLLVLLKKISVLYKTLLKTISKKENNLVTNMQSNLINQQKQNGKIQTTLLKTLNKTVVYTDQFVNNIMKAKQYNSSLDLKDYIKGPNNFGNIVIAVGIIISILWLIFAPLNSAVSIDGQIVLESKKRILQSPYGGLIEKIYIKNGDYVKKDDILIKTDTTGIKEKYKSIQLRYLQLIIEYARLEAELNSTKKIIIPSDISSEQMMTEDFRSIIQNQNKILETNINQIENNLSNINIHIQQYTHKKSSLKKQLESLDKQLYLQEERVNSIEKLLNDGNSTKDQMNNLLQNGQELLKYKIQVMSEIQTIDSQILQAQNELNIRKQDFFSTINQNIKIVNDNINYVKGEMILLSNQLESSDIKSPIDGIVTNLLENTENGVINPGYPILEIIPQDDNLVFDARIRAEDIDLVQKGKYVSVRLSPFKSRVVPPIDGVLVDVSADIIKTNHPNDIPHYRARVELDSKSLDILRKTKNVILYPGMHGQGLLPLGNRTPLQMMLEPIRNTFEKAFIEQ